MMSDLSKLNLRTNDMQFLIDQGYTSLTSIAMASRSDLGLSKNAADRIIQSAQNIILNDHIKKIEMDSDKIRIFIDKSGIDEEVFRYCIMWQFGIWDKPSELKWDIEKKCYWFITTDYRNSYAKKWIGKIKMKTAEIQKMNGITIDEGDIREFAEDLRFDGFWESLFQEIKGNEIMKQAISIALFSTFDEPCHICILGDPGSSKSLSYDIINKYFPDVVPIGANSTKAGLVINLVTGELGALATSDNKVVIADEFDKIPKADIPYCYELLSNGKCKVDSARIHDVIESHFILIAMGNPKAEVFGSRPIDQINLPSTLMSRFALVVRTEVLEPEDRLDLFKQKFYQNFERLENPEMFVQWVRLARTFQPKITADEYIVEDYIEEIGQIVNGHYNTPLRRDLRMGDYLRRVPFSIARANFENVTEDILEQSQQIFKGSIGTW